MSERAMMSIGAVSRATGIPASTLRTWERRYDFPVPERTAGGQRAYPSTVVTRLRLIARALERGHRAGAALAAPESQLREWAGPTSAPKSDELSIDAWMDATRRLDGETLEQGFRKSATKHGLSRFLDQAADFLVRLGEAWHEGHLGVHHEHQASERLRAFLFATWRDMADRNPGRTVICTTLPGERHDLGLHMAAAALAVGGARIVFLGADAPVDSIVAASDQVEPRAVIVSISIFLDSDEAKTNLEAVREHLDDEITVIVGGKGAIGSVPGTTVMDDLDELTTWAAG